MKLISDENHQTIILHKIVPFILAGTITLFSGCSTQTNAQTKWEKIQSKNAQIITAYYEGTLRTQLGLGHISLSFAPIDEDFIKNLPPDLKCLSLAEAQFLKSLDELPISCPELEILTLKNCSALTNFNFIYNLNNLKELTIIGETLGITQDLIDYLNAKGIKHNLTTEETKLDQQIQAIVDQIITEDMSDEEKIAQIVLYVLENVDYNIDKAIESNKAPLKCALDGEGVCISIANLTQALMIKSGLTAYVPKNIDHAWNLVEIEGKYYYIDVTNIPEIPFLTQFLLKNFHTGIHYKQDPYATTLSQMSDLDELMTPTPKRLLELIDEANNQKSFIEKYGSNFYVNLMIIAGILIGITSLKSVIIYYKRK